jgi:hypothetical protein
MAGPVRIMAALESAVGQVCLAVFIARLVGLHTVHSRLETGSAARCTRVARFRSMEAGVCGCTPPARAGCLQSAAELGSPGDEVRAGWAEERRLHVLLEWLRSNDLFAWPTTTLARNPWTTVSPGWSRARSSRRSRASSTIS